ncbi:MAG: PQQ-binding-like beta-propeller repeat protein [Streptosporangiaceae bacterium]
MRRTRVAALVTSGASAVILLAGLASAPVASAVGPSSAARTASTQADARAAARAAAARGGSAAQRTGRAAAQDSSAAADWPAFLNGPEHSSYNAAATSITPDNLSSLEPVWQWIVPPSPNVGSTTLWASPVVSDGVVYIGAEDGYFYALDEATKQVLWSDFLGLITPTTCPGTQGVLATATVANDPTTGNPTVYINAPDGYAYALDAATGAVVWQSVVGIPSTTQNNYYAWASPLVTNGTVYVGISSECDDPLVPAGVLAFNQSTGALVAQWHSLPKNKLGASVWSSPGVTADGQIIAATGNGYGGSGQPPYDDSIVELNPSTLAVESSWEVPAAQQIYDGDFGGSPTMFTATVNGTSTPLVGICNKNGTYYAFNQDNLSAGPVWQATITNPYTTGSAECVAAAVWDGNELIEGGGNSTTINGTSYMGSVQALNPATGVPIWQTGLPGIVVGSPTEDGAGVVAAVTLQSSGQNGVYLLSAATGAILDFIPMPGSYLFGQPIFAQNDLLVGGGSGEGLTAYDITTAGPPVTAVTPSTIGDSTTDTVKLTGSGFSGAPSVIVSGDGVFATKVTVTSPATLTVTMTVKSNASQTARNITVVQPGSPDVTSTCTSCLTVGPKPAKPTATSLTPGSFVQGAKKVAAVLAGTNFDPGSVVTTHSGMSATTSYVSSTQLNLSVTVKATTAPGAYNLTVTDSDGLQATCKGCLTVTAAGAAAGRPAVHARLAAGRRWTVVRQARR